MTTYEMVYVVTNILHVLAVNRMVRVFVNKASYCNKWKRIILVGYWVVLSIVVFITRIPIFMLFINVLCCLCVTMTYRVSSQKRFLVVSVVCTILLMNEIVVSAILGIFELSGVTGSEVELVTLIVLVRLSGFVLAYVSSRYNKGIKKEYSIPLIYYLAFTIVLLGTLYMFVALLENENITIQQILLNAIILIAVNVTIVFVDERVYSSIILENEKKLLQQENNAYVKQMQLISESIESTRIMKHDFKNHLIVLKDISSRNNSEEFEEYVCKLIGNIEGDIISNSNNLVIDSIINFKISNVYNEQIVFTLDVSVPNVLNVAGHDLTVILGNLLDNAIEASMKTVEKIIEISISTQKENLVIIIKNSYNGELLLLGGEFKTSKSSEQYHGLGITSIKKTVLQCGGEVEIEYTEEKFIVSVVLPC